MEFFTEPQSQCEICDYGWFKTGERPKKVHSKWNSILNRDLSVESVITAGSTPMRARKVHSKWDSTLNRDLNVESVTTAGSKPVRGRKMSIQNGTES